MRIAMLSPIAWRTPPEHYGPWESVVSLLTEGLIKRGIEVTLFATCNSQTKGKLVGVASRGYEEDKNLLPKVWECLHISELFERADEFDLIHNHFDYLPLTYMGMTSTPVLTTIHGFSSPRILPVYKKYNKRAHYVSISDADRSPELDYIATIHHGIELNQFTLRETPGEYLLFFGRIHYDKGAKEAIELARKFGMKLIIAGIIQDEAYYEQEVEPYLDENNVVYVGSADPKTRDELLGGAYALLHPINFDEPFGLSVIESMACGTPVVAFNRGSMSEIISNWRTGFLVSSVEEANNALKKVKEIDRTACRRWVEQRFSADRMVDEYIGVYEQILAKTHREDHRPWGHYVVLEDKPEHKIKRIVVYPGQRLSLQRHCHRAEHWHIIHGQAVVTRDGDDIGLKNGQAIDLPQGAWHRIMNPGKENLVFIEIQTGSYFGEDDIERVEDDYGRV